MVRNRFFLGLPGAAGPRTARSDAERVHARANAGQEAGSPDPTPDLAEFQSSLEEIPLPNGSLDAVVLHHVLEAAADPRTAIRELSRVLAPGGRLVICTFNPFSLWGIRGVWARVREDGFSDLKFVNPIRLMDWLAVLGFELQHEVKYMAYGLPFPTGDRDPQLWKWIRARLARYRIPFGGVYLISAVKQAAAARPSRDLGHARGRALAPAAYPKINALLRTPPGESESP
jgi:SAM-dependent methyltransferase